MNLDEQVKVVVDVIDELKGEEIGRECPECGAPLLKIHGRFGTFIY